MKVGVKRTMQGETDSEIKMAIDNANHPKKGGRKKKKGKKKTAQTKLYLKQFLMIIFVCFFWFSCSLSRSLQRLHLRSQLTNPPCQMFLMASVVSVFDSCFLQTFFQPSA
jgi:hypothetical protein